MRISNKGEYPYLRTCLEFISHRCVSLVQETKDLSVSTRKYKYGRQRHDEDDYEEDDSYSYYYNNTTTNFAELDLNEYGSDSGSEDSEDDD